MSLPDLDRLGVDPALLRVLAAVYGFLLVATLVTWLARKLKPGLDLANVSSRIGSWWLMLAVFTLALVLSRNVSLVFFTMLSFLALKEYFSLIPTRRADRRVLLWAYLAIPVQYLWVGLEYYGMFIIWIPVYMFLFTPMRMILIGRTQGFLQAAGTIHWGLMATVFSLSHLAFLLVLPASGNPNGGGGALVLYLVLLTQLNDVAQFLWGKALGRHPVVPNVSPNKTREGLLGGLATTILLAVVLAPWLTPLAPLYAALAGLLIGLFGFVGDVVISALKRDLGIKDSGSMLPGHGGILDRLDSLTYTAPLFFHYIRHLHY